MTKPKGSRYEIRDEIEDIIKKTAIDRNLFHEFSKSGYREIINKFYFNFCDRENYCMPSVISVSCFRHFRKDLSSYAIDCFFRTYDQEQFLDTVKSEITDNDKKLFLILDEGWVYEGNRDNVFAVLKEIDSVLGSFFIVFPKFDRFILYDSMEDAAFMFVK